VLSIRQKRNNISSKTHLEGFTRKKLLVSSYSVSPRGRLTKRKKMYRMIISFIHRTLQGWIWLRRTASWRREGSLYNTATVLTTLVPLRTMKYWYFNPSLARLSKPADQAVCFWTRGRTGKTHEPGSTLQFPRGEDYHMASSGMLVAKFKS